ncbi:MAG: hypothetical protein AAF726_03370 [Planctomycetota bacterium]
MKVRRFERKSESGIALVYAVFGTLAVASMASIMFTMAGVSDRRADLTRGSSQARFLADGALNVVVKELQGALAAWDTPPTAGTMSVAGVDVQYSVEVLGPQVQTVARDGVVNLVQPFEVEAVAVVDEVVVRSHRIVNARWTPLFQFAVFYNDDLEIHAGPDMTLRGRVHSNSGIYIGGGQTITLDTNYVHAVDGIFRWSKRAQLPTHGSVDIRRWVENPFDANEPSEFELMLSATQFPADSISGYDSAFRQGYDDDGNGDFFGANDWLPFMLGAKDLWGPPAGYLGEPGHTVMTGSHGVTEAVTPPLESIQMYDQTEGGSYTLDPVTRDWNFVGAGNGTHDRGYYYDNAGLAVVVDPATRTFEVFDGLGNEITPFVSDAVTLTSVPDMRQSAGGNERVPAVQIDMGALAQTSYFPSNGLVFAAHGIMGEGAAAGGVVLTNGAELAGALTVVSPGSVYVQGDYNVVDKKGAAVIGDAVNLLSNSWDGTKAPGTLPVATETTYNFAMLTGSYETTSGRYNGGLENLPRFHENWNNVACNIAGSFVNLYDSQFATGDWMYGGDRYTAPIRNWQYDSDFNSLSALPPFTPMAVNSAPVVTW